jgi:hypothetical protein
MRPPGYWLAAQGVPSVAAVTVVAALACSRPAATTSPDAGPSGPHELAVRVPAALMIARAIDALSVAVDPTSLAFTSIVADTGMVLGVERTACVFPVGQAPPASGRSAVEVGADFTVAPDTWTLKQDGIPEPGTRYAAEVRFVIFQTDVPPTKGWDPHAGHYRALWSRTLHQAEE